MANNTWFQVALIVLVPVTKLLNYRGSIVLVFLVNVYMLSVYRGYETYNKIFTIIGMIPVVEIRIRIGRPLFEDRIFYRLLIAVQLKIYRKFGLPKWILVGQMLKLAKNCQCPTVISSIGLKSY